MVVSKVMFSPMGRHHEAIHQDRQEYHGLYPCCLELVVYSGQVIWADTAHVSKFARIDAYLKKVRYVKTRREYPNTISSIHGDQKQHFRHKHFKSGEDATRGRADLEYYALTGPASLR